MEIYRPNSSINSWGIGLFIFQFNLSIGNRNLLIKRLIELQGDLLVWNVNKSVTHKFDRYTIIKDEVVLPNKEEKTLSYIDFAKGVCVLAVIEE